MSDTPISSRMPDHPCYGFSHTATAARVHLPVAPRCNVQCRFCDRSFDCANESRPGVTARLLSPEEAAARVDALRERLPTLAVVGIAGPGDPLANPRESFETFRLVKERHPDLILCLATNGLGLIDHVDEIERVGVSHLTVTVNAIDPAIGERVYSWVRIEGRARTGVPAAALLWERQLAGIILAARRGIEVKINTILVPGVNEGEVERIARECAVLGAKCMNIVPLIPVEGTPLEHAGAPDHATVARLRANASEYLPQLSHCARCRADAAGPLGSDIPPEELSALDSRRPAAARPCGEPGLRSAGGYLLAAVASREGFFVNQHLGEADRLFIFRVGGDGTVVAQSARPLPPPGGGDERWAEVVRTVSDCDALFASGLGAAPRRALEGAGIRVHVVEGLAAEALRAAAAGRNLEYLAPRAACGSGCSGSASGGCGCA
jgi:nitrogen fixation protein NifB